MLHQGYLSNVDWEPKLCGDVKSASLQLLITGIYTKVSTYSSEYLLKLQSGN